MGDTKIEWAEKTWNPIRGCSVVSAGCKNCYAMTFATRFTGEGKPYEGLAYRNESGAHWTGKVKLIEEHLEDPLRWKRPRRIFVNSMSDLFHESIPDEWIDRIFAVMALSPQHVFQVLTKRPQRMRNYILDPPTPYRVARQSDQIEVSREITAMGPEEIRPIVDYPGYFVSDRGRVLSSSGSSKCLFCGKPVDGIAIKAYCDKKCRQNACYYRRIGRPREGERTLAEMAPDVGDQGHLRVMLYKNGKGCRELVHRLVLTTFNRKPVGDEQSCHRNGDPSINALPNLRWGTQADNWEDRKRHGNHRSYQKLSQTDVDKVLLRGSVGESAHSIAREFPVSETQVRNILNGDQWKPSSLEWPLKNCWAGVSCEDQKTADERIPLLLQTPAAARWISAEPLLGLINLRAVACHGAGFIDVLEGRGHDGAQPDGSVYPFLDWVVAGGESGSGSRPMHPDWARSLRDQCVGARVPFFFKQWGNWGETATLGFSDTPRVATHVFRTGTIETYGGGVPAGIEMRNVGKKSAGRLLDGHEWNEYPGER